MTRQDGGYAVWAVLVAALAAGCGEEADGRDLSRWGPSDTAIAGEAGEPSAGDLVIGFDPAAPPLPPGPPVLLAKVVNPTSVAADPNGVYWTSAAKTATELSAVFEQAWEGDGMHRVASHKGYPVSLALQGEHVYWLDMQHGDVLRMRRAGEHQVETVARAQAAPYALAVTDRFVAWTNIGDGAVMAYDRYQKQLAALAKGEGEPAAIAVNTDRVVWIDLRDGAIRAASLFGGDVVTLVEDVELGDGLAIDEAHAYYGDHAKRAVMRVPLAGGEPEIVVANQADVEAIAVAGDVVVWTSARFGEIRQTRGGVARVYTIASLQADPASLAISNGRVHWVSRGDGGIWLAGLGE